jgi:hypothetical protein
MANSSQLDFSSRPSSGCAFRFFRCGTRSVGVLLILVLDLTTLPPQSPFTEDGRRRERLLRPLPFLRKIPFSFTFFGTLLSFSLYKVAYSRLLMQPSSSPPSSF